MDKMSNQLVSIIIVTAEINNYILNFLNCLDSVKDQSYPHLETIVIANSCDSNFGRNLNKLYPQIKLYSSTENLYYSNALNKGISLSNGEFILCLNDDIILDKNFITLAVNGFNISPKIGMISGKILRFDKKTIDSTGLFLTIWRTAKERGYGKLDKKQYDSQGYIFGVSGAAAFYRRQMLEQIKINSEYFDSDFHFYYEDLDIAWRAYNFGWKAYFIPEAVVYHKRGGTARKNKTEIIKFARFSINDTLLFHLIKNRQLSILKNDNLFRIFLLSPFITFYDLLALIHILLFKFKSFKKIYLQPVPFKTILKKRIILKKKLINKSKLA
ncbi:MAG: glycosyltransferase [Candidatus Omnitrophota bacterium]